MFVKSVRQAIPPSVLRAATSLIRGKHWLGANPEDGMGCGIEGPSRTPVPTRKTGCGAFDPAAVVIVTWRAATGRPYREWGTRSVRACCRAQRI